MTISVTCPTCGREFSKIKSEMAGKKVRCPCGATLRLPNEDTPPSSPSQFSPNFRGTESTSQTKPSRRARLSIDPFERHYSDLDDILAGDGKPDSDFHSDNRSMSPQGNQDALRNPSLIIDSQSDRSVKTQLLQTESKGVLITPFQQGLIFLLAFSSSLTAFGFAIFLISARLVPIQFPILAPLAGVLTQIYSGQFGLEEINTSIRVGLLITGWVILLMSILILLLALTQFISAALQLFSHLLILRWGDGLIAAVAISFIFLFIGTLFLHSAHIQNVKRQFNQVSISSGDEEPANIRRLREEYQVRTVNFTWSITQICVPPALIFGCSMVRLMIRVR